MKLKMMKAEVELGRLEQAKREMEFKILERLEDIERIKENIEIQVKAIEEKKQELDCLREE